VLGYVGAIPVEPACRRVFVVRDAIAPDGIVTDTAARTAITAVLHAITDQLL
jgi:hypothetical protein